MRTQQVKLYNTNFTSRNAEIRFADNIARHVNKTCPRISSTLLECSENNDLFTQLIEDLTAQNNSIRLFRNKLIKKTPDYAEKIKIFLNSIKKHKKGNCGESAELTLIAAKLNGIKDAKIYSVEHPKGFSYDHAVVYIKNNKKPYIIDGWLGFADYAPNAIKRFQKEYHNAFDFYLMPNEQMAFSPANISQFNNIIKHVSQKQLQKICPELSYKIKSLS